MAAPMLTRGRVAALFSVLAGVILFGYHARRIFARRRRNICKEPDATGGVSCSQEARLHSTQTPPRESSRIQRRSPQGSSATSTSQSPVIRHHAHQQENRPAQSPGSSQSEAEDKWGLSSPSALSSFSSLTDKTDTETEIEEAAPKTGAKPKKKLLTKKSRLPLLRKKSKETEIKTSESESDGVFHVRTRSGGARKSKQEDGVHYERSFTLKDPSSSGFASSEADSIVEGRPQRKVPCGSSLVQTINKEYDSDEKTLTLTSEGEVSEQEGSFPAIVNRDKTPQAENGHKHVPESVLFKGDIGDEVTSALNINREAEEKLIPDVGKGERGIVSIKPNTAGNKDALLEIQTSTCEHAMTTVKSSELGKENQHINSSTDPIKNSDSRLSDSISFKEKVENKITYVDPEKEPKKKKVPTATLR